ncbi:MAG: hypothetical protein BVN35_11190 [Proteobacteria bacterium ST_bin11]|nr:MAG: hypothetical protein BVN35_11190 [Proteobacteria bacterium ST_bin11]
MDTLDDFTTLEQDASLSEPLRRVAYEAGMMLGLEATRDEQAYHRRRLTRHQYWLQGYGTLAGMAVSMAPATHPNNTDNLTVRLLVSPGIGIDGLGREVLIHEPYCINLGDWLAAQSESHLREGYSDADNLLWLKICVRQKDCPVAMQPVLARKLNLSTDAVQPSRTADSVRLELIPELPPPAADDDYQPWACHQGLPAAMPALSAAEQALLQQVQNDNSQAGAQLALHARLLHALDGNGVNPQQLQDELEEGARLLLARISISVADINAILVNPQLISINNLVRPFLATASQLAWLARQP